jgi:hypothetical protein
VKRLLMFAVVLGLLVVMVSGGSVAGATASQAVNGTWQVGNLVSRSTQPVGGNCIIDLVTTLNWQGDLEGTSSQTTRILHFGPCDQPAPEVFQSRGTFQGTVDGISGSFDFLVRGIADTQGNIQAPLVILRGDGGLVNLRGLLTLTGPLVPGGAYSGHIFG